MPDFIDNEIARHCPNPTSRSKALIAVTPLVLWQVLRLVEEDSNSVDGTIRSTCKLVDEASVKLTAAGMGVSIGSLVRKVCVPIIARYVAHHVGRRLATADMQRRTIRERAECVFREKILSLITPFLSRDTDEIHFLLYSKKDLSEALRSDDADKIVAGGTRCAIETPSVIELGRSLFA